MSSTKVIRRVGCSPEQQHKLSLIFAKKQVDGTLKPLDLSTVRNYLNETRYPNPKARELREYAVKVFGCEWVTTVIG